MPTYISLLKWTPQGLRDLKSSPARVDAARKGFAASGVILKEFYMVTGQYDCIAVAEAPDFTTLTKAILAITSQGTVTSATCRAFPKEEYRQIVGSLP